MNTKSKQKKTILLNGEYTPEQLLSIIADIVVARGDVKTYNDYCMLLPQKIVASHNRLNNRRLRFTEMQTLDDISQGKYSGMFTFSNAVKKGGRVYAN